MLELVYLLTPIYITLFWSIVLNSLNKKENRPKLFLGKFMLAAFVVYISHFFYFTRQFNIYIYTDSLYTLASLLVYPLYYIYVRLLTIDLEFTLRKHAKYLAAPVIVALIYFVSALFISSQDHLEFLQKPKKGFSFHSGSLSFISVSYILYRVVFIIQVFFFVFRNFQLISQSKNRLKDFFSNPDENNLSWVQLFNVSLAITSLASLILVIKGRESFVMEGISMAIPSIVFSLMLFSIGLLGLKANTKAIPIEDIEEEKQQVKKAMSYATEEQMVVKIEELFEKDQVFKNPNLKIWDLSSMLGTNRSYASHIINKQYKRNFRHHVNHYRIKMVAEMLEKNPHLKNEELVDGSGFGSLSSLYRAFLDERGTSFHDFREDLAKKQQKGFAS